MIQVQETREVIVTDHRCLAPNIHLLELSPISGGELPIATPGAHVDIWLPNGMVRQYSLLDEGAEGRYRIGVQRDARSRGGSRCLVEEVVVGTRMTISLPRCNFALEEGPHRSVLIAGGIGVTPLVAMARKLVEQDAPLEVHYLVSSGEVAGFHAELEALLPPGCLHLHDASVSGRVALASLMGSGSEDVRVYACGPESLLNDMETLAQDWPSGRLIIERFRGSATPAAGGVKDCEIVLRRSGHCFILKSGERLLDALHREGYAPDSLCGEGVCGTCAIGVVEGAVDHRDELQSEEEKQDNDLMYACVSQPLGERLVLDI